MLSRRNSNNRPISEINVVPYIDVMLVLLVIFMITAPMLTQGIAVDLPKTTTQALKTNAMEPIIVSVNQEGKYFLNTSATPGESILPHDLYVQVASQLRLAQEDKKLPQVLVKGDTGVAYGKVVEAMSLLKQAGAEKVGLVTDSPMVTKEVG